MYNKLSTLLNYINNLINTELLNSKRPLVKLIKQHLREIKSEIEQLLCEIKLPLIEPNVNRITEVNNLIAHLKAVSNFEITPAWTESLKDIFKAYQEIVINVCTCLNSKNTELKLPNTEKLLNSSIQKPANSQAELIAQFSGLNFNLEEPTTHQNKKNQEKPEQKKEVNLEKVNFGLRK